MLIALILDEQASCPVAEIGMADAVRGDDGELDLRLGQPMVHEQQSQQRLAR